ncbi:MAG: DUF350 domain-containing protein [Rhodospirillales bacterium]|nr:DUF350 domain-containing protein [Rhodospirillales bacterium]
MDGRFVIGGAMQIIGLYLAYVGVSVGLVGLATWVYALVTPYKEIALIREGNAAAAYSLGGMVIGFAAAVASAAAHSVSLVDMALWSGVALLAQVFVYWVVSFFLQGFQAGMEDGKVSYGIALGAASIAMGVLNAGALTY